MPACTHLQRALDLRCSLARFVHLPAQRVELGLVVRLDALLGGRHALRILPQEDVRLLLAFLRIALSLGCLVFHNAHRLLHGSSATGLRADAVQ